MRYFLICVAAFMLLAVPAMAVTEDTAEVTVTIGSICNLDVTGAPVFEPTWEDLDAGSMTLTDAIGIDLYANFDWKVQAKYDGWDNSGPWGLTLENSGTGLVLTTSYQDWITGDGGNPAASYWDLTLTGLTWDDEDGDDDATTLYCQLISQ